MYSEIMNTPTEVTDSVTSIIRDLESIQPGEGLKSKLEFHPSLQTIVIEDFYRVVQEQNKTIIGELVKINGNLSSADRKLENITSLQLIDRLLQFSSGYILPLIKISAIVVPLALTGTKPSAALMSMAKISLMIGL